MGGACRTHADVLRGFALHFDNVAGEIPEARTFDLDLCGLVYSFTLCGGFTGEGEAPDPPELVAVIRLQDSQFELWSDCCKLHADLPGLKWPASAKLIVAPGAAVTLNVAYGDCGPAIAGQPGA